jgi:hypothetical protein
MLLSVALHVIAAISLALMCALTLHFILLVPYLPGGLAGLLIYLLLFALTWRSADADIEG